MPKVEVEVSGASESVVTPLPTLGRIVHVNIAHDERGDEIPVWRSAIVVEAGAITREGAEPIIGFKAEVFPTPADFVDATVALLLSRRFERMHDRYYFTGFGHNAGWFWRWPPMV